ncbi:hypothetical protein VPNG_05281 [Cytospora leucostoma]|uniref:Enoyl reductase (ER) domain-containing protein n=1 Tax=Cytospora leucostoma TaxID=1230097 RepID=A0A423X7T9_9PEZI|nr:hypothetical protein VPNG_05281 [Cytospora leucostoma]
MSKRSVLITGCSEGGLGFALARTFQQTGFHVFATARNLTRAGSLASEPDVELLELDVTSPESISSCVQQVAKKTGSALDVLVNSSGTAIFGPLAHASIAGAKNLYDVNVWGALAVAQAFIPMLIQAKGIMLNIASISGAVPLAWQGIYNSSKAAVTFLSETMKIELEPLGVRVVTAMVGATGTGIYTNGNGPEMTLSADSWYKPIEEIIGKQARGELQEPHNEPVDSDVVSGASKFPQAWPLVFGTCCVGRIEDVGADVTFLKAGQLVFCDHIVYARDAPEHRIVLGYHGGHSEYERKLSSGHWRDGCWSEYARFPVENVHAVDEQLIAQKGIAAEQLCEVSCVMSAIGAANSIQVRAGETVLVMPATGFFSSGAVTALLGMGANVVAVSRNKDTLNQLVQHYREDGDRITPLVLIGDLAKDTDALKAATPGSKGADAFIDFSSPESAGGTYFQAGLQALKRNARCVLAGAIPDNLQLPYLTVRINCLTVKGSFAQNREDVEFAIRLIESGNLKLRKTIAGRYPLDEYETAVSLSKATRGWEQMVIVMP